MDPPLEISYGVTGTSKPPLNPYETWPGEKKEKHHTIITR